MKITMYELLGMVKDGKAPKTVKNEGHYYTYNELVKDYYEGMGYDYEYLLRNTSIDRLNDEVEILDDEDKGKSKVPIKLYSLEMLDEDMSHETAIAKQRYNNGRIRTKINEIIDYLEKQRKGE